MNIEQPTLQTFVFFTRWTTTATILDAKPLGRPTPGSQAVSASALKVAEAGAAEDTTGAAPGGAEARELPRGASWGLGMGVGGYPKWSTYKKLLKMTIEIVDFPIKDGDFPVRYVNVCQRVPFGKCSQFAKWTITIFKR